MQEAKSNFEGRNENTKRIEKNATDVYHFVELRYNLEIGNLNLQDTCKYYTRDIG